MPSATVSGVVVSLSAFGAAVHLPAYGVEGLIRREALGPDHWQFDEQSQCLLGRHTGALVRLGQRLRVRLVDVHPTAEQLDLAPAADLIAPLPASGRQPKTAHRRRPKHRPRRNRQ